MPSCRQKLKSEVQRVSENVGKQEPSYVAGEIVISTTILQSNLAISVTVEHVQTLWALVPYYLKSKYCKQGKYQSAEE